MTVDADVFASDIAFEIALMSDDPIQQSEVVIRFAERVLQNVSQGARCLHVSSKDERRVGNVIQFIETHIEETLSLNALAMRAGLSAYHFLRVFKGCVRISPHQFIVKWSCYWSLVTFQRSTKHLRQTPEKRRGCKGSRALLHPSRLACHERLKMRIG
jgi:AraC-like DNA-binding protein